VTTHLRAGADFNTTFQQRKLHKKKFARQFTVLQRIEIAPASRRRNAESTNCQSLEVFSRDCAYWITLARAGQAHNWDAFRLVDRMLMTNIWSGCEELVSHSPRDYGYPFQRWTARWHLAKIPALRSAIAAVLLKEMGLSTRRKSKTAEK